MSNLRSSFSNSAPKAGPALLGASLDLLVADTRRGMDAHTQQAYLAVAARAAGNPRRAGYLAHYKEAAGAVPQARHGAKPSTHGM